MATRYFSATPANATQESYYAVVMLRWMISAVARVMRPGCKADGVLILEGKQGVGKSSSLRILAGERLFSDGYIDPRQKDTFALIRTKWIVEVSELAAFSKTDQTLLKQFFTQCTDEVRDAFGRRSAPYPRHCVFCGTTNQDDYLRDRSGNRRYWPVRVGRVDLEGLARDRDQLWAEAVTLFHSGEPWHPQANELPWFEREQEERLPDDPLIDSVQEFLSEFGKLRERTSVEEVLQGLGLQRRDWSDPVSQKVGRSLVELGYQRTRRPSAGPDGKRGYYYVRGASNDQ